MFLIEDAGSDDALKSELLHSGIGTLYWKWRAQIEKESRRMDDAGMRYKKLATNTYLIERPPDAYAIKLHQTDIITAYKDGRVVFNTNGWITNVTMARIQEYLPADLGWSLFAQPSRDIESVDHPSWYGGYTTHYGARYRVSGRRLLAPWFWYNRKTGEGGGSSGWYIPYTDGDYITGMSELHAQAPKIPRKRKKQWP